MLANIEKTEYGYCVEFQRHFNTSVEEVWSWLTTNKKLSQWFSEISIDNLREGGFVMFDMQDGTFVEMEIYELKDNSVLEYNWGEDRVRFELYPEAGGCLLLLKEKLQKITDHTPKDLAGWHVCLDVIQTLIDNRTLGNREFEWKKWYEKYIEEIERITNSNL
ncbi:MAG: hypothetical protein K0S47_1288 [Herbinix sp.]|jgi:uncharacterized protein YndB with AHSA1/START domain|nr:hypothetical protein [Herbinix sp.]